MPRLAETRDYIGIPLLLKVRVVSFMVESESGNEASHDELKEVMGAFLAQARTRLGHSSSRARTPKTQTELTSVLSAG